MMHATQLVVLIFTSNVILVFLSLLYNEIKANLAESLVLGLPGSILPRFIAVFLFQPVVKRCKHFHGVHRQAWPVWGAYLITDAEEPLNISWDSSNGQYLWGDSLHTMNIIERKKVDTLLKCVLHQLAKSEKLDSNFFYLYNLNATSSIKFWFISSYGRCSDADLEYEWYVSDNC